MDSFHMPANHRALELSRALIKAGHEVHLVAQFGCVHEDFIPALTQLGVYWCKFANRFS
jgi:hypothetical protein